VSLDRKPPRTAGRPGERRRHAKIQGQFAPRRIEMLESPTYRVLSLSARRLIDRIEIELANHGGRDNGRLPVPFSHFVRYGIERHQIAPAIREAEELGFIEVTQRGRAGNREFRTPHKFRLTYRHTADAEPTDEWRRVTTIEDAKRIQQAARTATRKTKTQCGKTHHETPPFGGVSPPNPSAGNPTTVHGGESRTTLDTSRLPGLRSRQRASAPKARKPKNPKKGGAGGIPPQTTNTSKEEARGEGGGLYRMSELIELGPRYWPPPRK
jgi:hypothetical protein